MLGARAAIVVLGGVAALSACGGSEAGGGSEPDGGSGTRPESGGDLWELRVPLAEASPDGRSVTAVYQILPGTPIEDVLVRTSEDEVGLTLRARIPKGPIIAIAWGFECVEFPLPEPLGDRAPVDDSRRRYPGSESGIDDATARESARQLLQRDRPCSRLDAGKVGVVS